MNAKLAEMRSDLRSVSPAAMLSIGLAVTGLALVESWKGWIYAPFPIAYALLTVLIPVWFRCLPVGNPWRELVADLRLVVAPFTLALLFIGAYLVLYSVLLRAAGRIGDPNWNLLATYRLFGHLYIMRYGRLTVVLVGYLLVGIWPMFGEEFFYRGFLFKGLMYHMSPTKAAVISAFLFGLRHAVQLVYLLPAYPVVAGAAYFVWAAGLALFWAWAYYRTRSLWPCILTHGANLFLAPVVFSLLKL